MILLLLSLLKDPMRMAFAELTRPQAFVAEIDRLHKRHALGSGLFEIRQEGMSLAGIVERKKDLARKLAAEIRDGAYRIAPGSAKEVMLDKKRVLFSFDVTDYLLHAAIARLLEARLSPLLSSDLYSYRPGYSQSLAVRRFCDYLKRHRASRPDARQRGLYVLRRDIKSYTDTIPLGESAPIWPQLRALSEGWSEYEWDLLRQVVRPAYLDRGANADCTALAGLAMGSPICTVLGNLYLMPLDRELGSVDGAFYARYGDDFIFAHPDADVAREVAARAGRCLDALGLRVNQAKARDLYFTGCGRRGSSWSESLPVQRVTFLGAEIDFKGTTRLTPDKATALTRGLCERLRNAAALAGAASRERKLEILCATANRCLDARDPLSLPVARELLSGVDDRGHLRQLDHRIALSIAELSGGRRGVKAFRHVSIDELRKVFRLRSLVFEKNGGRGDG